MRFPKWMILVLPAALELSACSHVASQSTDAGPDGSGSDTDTCQDLESPEGCVRFVNGSWLESGDGLTWCTPFVSVQEGIDAAHEAAQGSDSCQVWVTKGTYYIYESDASDTLELKPGVEVYGGFSGDEDSLEKRDWKDHETILDGHRHNESEERAWHVVTGSDDTVLDGLTVTGGFAHMDNEDADYPDRYGGGMYNSECSVIVRNCTFTGNTAQDGAGSAMLLGASAIIEGCAFAGNTADSPFGNGGSGGGLYVGGMSSVSVSDSVFDDNEAGNGAGIGLSPGGELSVAGSTFTNNLASGTGGGLRLSGPQDDQGWFWCVNTLFQGNHANTGGGIITSLSGANVTLEGCDFLENSADWSGGGAELFILEGEISDCDFEGNVASGSGGGLVLYGAEPIVSGCSFIGNSAADGGGGVYLGSGAEPTLSGCTFEGNTSRAGGAIDIQLASPTVRGCVFTGNDTLTDDPGNGGALYIRDSDPFSIENSLFVENRAGGSLGGAIYVEDTELDFRNCTFFENEAEYDPVYAGLGQGGAIYAWGSDTMLRNCLLWGNVPDEIGYSDEPFVVASHSLVSGGFGGEGNIDGDPLFVDSDDDNLHLGAGSPCIDAADGTVAPEFDIEDNERVDDPDSLNSGLGPPWADMGAYEYQP